MIQRDFDGGGETQVCRAQGVSHEDEVDVSSGGQLCGECVISRQGGNEGFPFGFTNSLNGFFHLVSKRMS